MFVCLFDAILLLKLQFFAKYPLIPNKLVTCVLFCNARLFYRSISVHGRSSQCSLSVIYCRVTIDLTYIMSSSTCNRPKFNVFMWLVRSQSYFCINNKCSKYCQVQLAVSNIVRILFS